MQALADRDYFTDYEILKDPYSFFEALRERGPIYRNPYSGIIYITGFEETLDVLKNTQDFSSAIAPQGPAAPLPFAPEGSDISADIDRHRTEFVGGDLLVAYDDTQHAFSRSIISRLFTPSRLKANEELMTEFADKMVKDAVARGGCELINDIATPFVTIVIADLLGVPADDRQVFMDAIAQGVGAGSLNPEDLEQQNAPLVLMGMYFAKYVQDRRDNPRGDILSELSNSTYPDGTTPDAMEIVRLATFLFAAGQDTSAKLLGNSMRYIVDQPGLQQQLRGDPSLIPAFLEEVLRLEGSTKMTARLARRDTRIGDLDVPAGTKVMLALAAANRDPRRWQEPQQLVLDRPRIKEHLAFGRGAHVCAGAPLARVEVRVILEKFLQYTSNIDLDPAKHGPREARRLDFEPSFIIRGLAELHVQLAPAEGLDLSSHALEVQAGREAPLPSSLASDEPAKSTGSTKIGDLLGNPETAAIIEKHLPGVAGDPRIGMAKSMTFRTIQKFAPDQFTEEVLDAIDADLARLPRQA